MPLNAAILGYIPPFNAPYYNIINLKCQPFNFPGVLIIMRLANIITIMFIRAGTCRIYLAVYIVLYDVEVKTC